MSQKAERCVVAAVDDDAFYEAAIASPYSSVLGRSFSQCLSLIRLIWAGLQAGGLAGDSLSSRAGERESEPSIH